MIQYTVQPGDNLSGICRAAYMGKAVNAVAEANGIADPNLIHVGDVLRLPDIRFDPLPDLEPDPIDNPEPEPAPEPIEPSTDILGLRTDARPSKALISAMTDTLGYPLQRLDFIPSAHNPRTNSGKSAPTSSIEFFRERGANYILDHIVETNIAHGRKGSDFVLSVAFPIGLREPGVTPSQPKSNPKIGADKVRAQLAKVAAGTYKWGYASSATDNRDYLTECVEPFADAIAGCLAVIEGKYGAINVPQVTINPGWECFGFSVFSWSSAGVIQRDRLVTAADNVVCSNGRQIVESDAAYWHTDHAIPEFVAAFKRVGDIFKSRNLSLSMCGDKRALDVIDDPGSEWHGRVISDILADELGAYIAGTAGLSGPAYWGADWYLKPHDNFDTDHRPGLELVLFQGRRFGMKFQAREHGIGTGREDEQLSPEDEAVYDSFGAARIRDAQAFFTANAADMGEIILYHPNNRHQILRGTEQRALIVGEVLRAANPDGPIYPFELP